MSDARKGSVTAVESEQSDLNCLFKKSFRIITSGKRRSPQVGFNNLLPPARSCCRRVQRFAAITLTILQDRAPICSNWTFRLIKQPPASSARPLDFDQRTRKPDDALRDFLHCTEAIHAVSYAVCAVVQWARVSNAHLSAQCSLNVGSGFSKMVLYG
jgi:hypothetical protein